MIRHGSVLKINYHNEHTFPQPTMSNMNHAMSTKLKVIEIAEETGYELRTAREFEVSSKNSSSVRK